ncbi:NAD(P)/FAD-dependent oxidoreductase [Tropicimonas isoalkanivorans]|uniref:L-2-hydroxyglutarate oxidase LhgO n=1 Tax=Tropicimonas isoalkanivorans TaxID=441112 RepID=A0A1I1LH04_9RHOB|nr:NAD(P)/FAD-dependent oxidoreductase [Tropicimonas isoalkanivorans]SFC72329.1 L-2-hydroxyglutarate oxidase LhgO [Tropicimonas isoalkanivorans]
MPDFGAIVIGGGVVGLACASALGEAGRPALVLEREPTVGAGISSRNSEVIHAGLYYPTGSLKHRLCVRGRRMLYDTLESCGVPYRKCGKIVVATQTTEIPAIEALAARARENGVEGIRMLSEGELHQLEPEVSAVAAMLSPETGVFDSHAFMLTLVARIEAQGGHVALRTPFIRAEPEGEGFRVWTDGDDPTEVTASVLVNAAGLSATEVATLIGGRVSGEVPDLRYAKGCYFGLQGRAPFKRLVYPAPVDGGLGVHATIDMAGRVRFGPDVEWLDNLAEADLDYRVPPARGIAFYEAVRRYWPALPDGALYPDYSGIRPKLSTPGATAADFTIETASTHGVSGLVNLFGIESPGLTASLAIAEHVADVISD